MDQSRTISTASHLPPAAIIRQAEEIEEVENFFVGLPDTQLPQPQNVLLFCSDRSQLGAVTSGASHRRHLLVFCLETAAVVLLDGLFVQMTQGQALLIFPFQTHRYLLPDEGKMVWLFVSFEMPSTTRLQPMRNRTVDIPGDIWPSVERLIVEFREAWQTRTDGGEVAALLSYLLLRLRRTCRIAPIPLPPLPQLADASHQVVQKAVQHIADHLREGSMAVTDIAAAAGVSAGHLRACFRRVLDITVTRYVRQARVHLACSLLSRTESNVSEIADRCGYESIYAFSRAFKQEIGMAPTHYRAHLWENRNISEPNEGKTSR